MITPVYAVHQDHHRKQYEHAGAILRVGVMVQQPTVISGGRCVVYIEDGNDCRCEDRTCFAERPMFEDRDPSIFPHPASAWWIPVLLIVGWLPLYLADFLYSHNWKVGEGFGMAWGMAVALPCTALAAISIPVQAFRLFVYFWSRPKQPPK